MLYSGLKCTSCTYRGLGWKAWETVIYMNIRLAVGYRIWGNQWTKWIVWPTQFDPNEGKCNSCMNELAWWFREWLKNWNERLCNYTLKQTSFFSYVIKTLQTVCCGNVHISFRIHKHIPVHFTTFSVLNYLWMHKIMASLKPKRIVIYMTYLIPNVSLHIAAVSGIVGGVLILTCIAWDCVVLLLTTCMYVIKQTVHMLFACKLTHILIDNVSLYMHIIS